MKIAVLALQGAFIEHERMLEKLGAECFEVRQLADWQQPKDALVIPGGESTTQLKLLKDLALLEAVRCLAPVPVSSCSQNMCKGRSLTASPPWTPRCVVTLMAVSLAAFMQRQR